MSATGEIPAYRQVAALVRGLIADGALKPGQMAPTGAALARATGHCPATCCKALRTLIADGDLVPGVGRLARPHIAGEPDGPRSARAAEALSRALVSRRRQARITQSQLAALIGFSKTTVGHAETGRVWQSRRFWDRADTALDAAGELLRRHDAYRAAF